MATHKKLRGYKKSMEFNEIRDCVHESEKVRVYARSDLFESMKGDRTLKQIRNVSRLPGLEGKAMVMPDGHEGYGFPIGGVAAFRVEDGVISPGGVGYDINCGMRLLRSDLKAEDVKPHVRELVEAFYENVPVGVGAKSRQRLTKEELGEAVTRGMDWAIENGVGTKKDAEHCEEGGAMKGADYSKVSDRAKKRGKPQLGTLGSGNHFLELQRVSQVFDEEKAKAFGLFEGQTTVMIHSGSRGYGHQICSDYIRVMLEASKKYGIELADPELCCAPVGSPEARDYAGAMASAVNYAFLNRFYMSHWVRQSFEQVLGNGDWESHGLHSVYDVCHNIAKFEEHDGKKLCVHRKGATRAFWAGREEVPADYRAVGQPVIIPGSMQTASYVLCGLPGAKESWGTVCHGAGRVMSRHAAIDSFNSDKLASEMNAKHIEVKAKNARTLSEEAGGAYKNVDAVVESVERAGLAKIVAKLEPMGVIKG